MLKSPQSPLADVVEGILSRERQAGRSVNAKAVERANHALEFCESMKSQDMAGLQNVVAVRQAGIRKKYVLLLRDTGC